MVVLGWEAFSEICSISRDDEWQVGRLHWCDVVRHHSGYWKAHPRLLKYIRTGRSFKSVVSVLLPVCHLDMYLLVGAYRLQFQASQFAQKRIARFGRFPRTWCCFKRESCPCPLVPLSATWKVGCHVLEGPPGHQVKTAGCLFCHKLNNNLLQITRQIFWMTISLLGFCKRRSFVLFSPWEWRYVDAIRLVFFGIFFGRCLCNQPTTTPKPPFVTRF